VNLLPQELSNGTTLETQNTELMTEVSSLKAKLAEVERDRKDAEVDTHTHTHTHTHTLGYTHTHTLGYTHTHRSVIAHHGIWISFPLGRSLCIV